MNLKLRVTAILKDVRFMSLSSDIMTTKGMRFSYLAVIAHAWYQNGWKSFVLDHIEMEESHTAGYIRKLCDSVMAEYEIPTHKIVRVVTDSAANMKAAFMQVLFMIESMNLLIFSFIANRSGRFWMRIKKTVISSWRRMCAHRTNFGNTRSSTRKIWRRRTRQFFPAWTSAITSSTSAALHIASNLR